ncbi:MAG: DUF72 domain-containing protein [Candidatus Bathyarchaeota archaeon]|nr:DUF72 domain-containing protein [Candidatus Bathyarchaeota archaeon]
MPKLHLGTIGWSYNFWKGNFYPAKTASKDYLSYYANQFNTVEVDSTFYRIPTQQTIQNWAAQTPEDFLFALKFPQLITHIKMLKNCQPETETFLNRVAFLEQKIGPLLLQFPPTFTAQHFADLADYIQKLPKNHRYVVEVRNKSWLTPEFYSLLRENGVALAWADNAIMAEVREVTGAFLYIRWEGTRQTVNGTLGKLEIDKTADLTLWAEKLKPFLSKTEVFGYFAKYYSGFPPKDISTLSALIDTQPKAGDEAKQLLSSYF